MTAPESRPSLFHVSDAPSDSSSSRSSTLAISTSITSTSVPSQSLPSSSSSSSSSSLSASATLHTHPSHHHHSHGRSEHSLYLSRLRNHQRGHHHPHHYRNRRDPAVDATESTPPDSISSLVTQVIETVSLIHVVDASGVPLTTETIYPAPATALIDPATGNTVAIPLPEDTSTVAVPGSSPVTTNDASPTSTSSTTSVSSSVTLPASTSLPASSSVTASSIASSSVSSSSISSSSVSSSSVSSSSSTSSSTTSASVTSSATTTAPSSSSTSSSSSISVESHNLSASAGAHNSTNPTASGGNMTVDATPRPSKTFHPLDHATTPTSNHRSTTRSTSAPSHTVTSAHWRGKIYSSSSSSSIYPLSTTSSSGSNGVLGGGGGVQSGSNPQATGASSSGGGGGSPGLSTQQKSIVGGVVGSVAGLAFLMLLVMMALRYKRRRDRNMLGDGDGTAGLRNMITGGGGGGGAPSMTERAAAPVGVTAALASLARKRKSEQSREFEAGGASGSGERGFYRVSGRKLPSVLMSGGDGYTDPRMSTISGETDYYRGSQAFEPVAGGTTRLALGTPMRPVSGVPIMRTGPGRTPQEENNPFQDPDSPTYPSGPGQPSTFSGPQNPVARSLAGSESSVSASRFQERI